MSLHKTNWLMATGGSGDSFIIEGWHPSSFDWDIHTLHSRQSQLKKVKIVFAHRPGQITGGQPDMLFDQLPVALLTGDRHTNEIFAPFITGFVEVPVITGIIRNESRFDKWGESFVLVPLEHAFYEVPDEIPDNIHMAIICNRFCVSTDLRQKLSFYVRDVVFVPFNPDVEILPPISNNYSNYFTKRVKSQNTDVENKILSFILNSLGKYQANYSKGLGALLLDCDPEYGYVILALKQSPVFDQKRTEIDDFEFEKFAVMEERKLYGETEFLPAGQLRIVLERVLEALRKDPRIMPLVGDNGLHLAYAFHDEEIHWISEIKQDA